MEDKPLYNYNLLDIIRVFNRFRKPILGITLLAAVVSVAIAMVLPVYYRSTTFLYPNNLTLADKSAIFGDQQNQSEFSYYGNKFDAYRMLQFANSSTVIDYIINKYKLVEHYGYGKNEQFAYTKTKEKFLKNYAAYKNDRDAIEISLFDTDKKLAADIVNDIAQKINDLSIEPIMENKRKIISMLEIEIAQKMKQKDSLGSIRSNPATEEELRELNKSLTEYQVSANDQISAITVLERAFPAEKKSKPIRWMIVVFGTLGAFALALLVAILCEQYRYLKKQLNP